MATTGHPRRRLRGGPPFQLPPVRPRVGVAARGRGLDVRERFIGSLRRRRVARVGADAEAREPHEHAS